MTGLAADRDFGHIGHRHIEGRVRVAVATQADPSFPQSKMLALRRGVTPGALGNGVFPEGQVLHMAVEAAYFGLMFAAGAGDIGRLGVVAFDAIGYPQLGGGP